MKLLSDIAQSIGGLIFLGFSIYAFTLDKTDTSVIGFVLLLLALVILADVFMEGDVL